jgi:hypothetical protein
MAGYHRAAPESHRVIPSAGTEPAGYDRRTWNRTTPTIAPLGQLMPKTQVRHARPKWAVTSWQGPPRRPKSFWAV